MYFSFFIGIIDLNTIHKTQPQTQNSPPRKILLFAQQIQIRCTINNKNILKITKPVYIFYNPKIKSNLSQDQAVILLNLGFVFQQGMYYSFTYDLTLPFYYIEQCRDDVRSQISSETHRQDNQHNIRNSQKNINNPYHQQLNKENQRNVNEQFNWAYNLQKQLSNFNKKWRIPVIQGFINKIENYVSGLKFRIVLISRRSRKNGGPYQFSTGFYNKNTNNSPNVANYVETQMIIHIKNLYFSFIQIRGTVPLYWKLNYSYGIASSITFPQSIQKNYKQFNNHITQIKNSHNYQQITLLNLMNKQSNIQKKLIQNYQYIVRKYQKQICYKYFDLEHRCRNKNYVQINKFINGQLRNSLLLYGFSVLEHCPGNKLKILSRQKGVIRTNCNNCIQKTNIIQSRIAAWQIINILNQLNIKITNFNDSLQFLDDNSSFAKLYRTIWADNCDAISEQYSGTNSSSSTIIRTNKISYLSSIDHGLTSIIRAIRTIIQEDFGKNKAILLLSLQQNMLQKNIQNLQKKSYA